MRSFVLSLGILVMPFVSLYAATPKPVKTEALKPSLEEVIYKYSLSQDLSAMPKALVGPALPKSDQALSLIAIGSCQTAEKPMPILDQIAASNPELMLYIGDNVYGDAREGNISLPELQAQYAKLNTREEFNRLRAKVPMMATWDDHDYGLNDAGGSFSGKAIAQNMFARFWGLEDKLKDQKGIYQSKIFGLEGKRVQIILLDTRYDRGALMRRTDRGPRGPYLPSTLDGQRMLSDAQWAWLAGELKKPAELRLIVSSIQVLADGHDFEAWKTLPKEKERFFATLKQSQAKGIVLISGDRHSAGLYKQEGILDYPLVEMTTSSLNLPFATSSDEKSTNQIGDMFTLVNFGLARIDWTAKSVTLEILDEASRPVRSLTTAF